VVDRIRLFLVGNQRKASLLAKKTFPICVAIRQLAMLACSEIGRCHRFKLPLGVVNNVGFRALDRPSVHLQNPSPLRKQFDSLPLAEVYSNALGHGQRGLTGRGLARVRRGFPPGAKYPMVSHIC
jgi:hypothetical protein